MEILIAIWIILYFLFCGIVAFKLIVKFGFDSSRDSEGLMLVVLLGGFWVPFVPVFKLFNWLANKIVR